MLVLLGLSMPPKVLCECGCGLFVSVHTVRRHLEGKARPHIHQQNSLFLLQTPQLSHLFASLYSLGRFLDSVQG